MCSMIFDLHCPRGRYFSFPRYRWNSKIWMVNTALKVSYYSCTVKVLRSVLTHYQTTKFGPDQIESTCRRQIKCNKKDSFCLWKSRKHCGKRGNCLCKRFLLFPQCFQKASFPDTSKGVIVWERVNPFPNKPWFLRVCCTSLLKTLWEKEKLLVTSNFSFSHSVFYSFGELSAIFVKFRILVCRRFEFERVKN